MNKQKDPDMLRLLSHPDDRTVEEIAAFVPFLDEDAKDRIVALCERKMSRDTETLRNNAHTYTGGVEKLTCTRWYRPLMAAAACLLVTAGLTGALFLNGQQSSGRPLPPVDTLATEPVTEASATETILAVHSDPEETASPETSVAAAPETQADTTGTHTGSMTVIATDICSVPTAAETQTETQTMTETTAPPAEAADSFTEQERLEGYRGNENMGYIINVAYPVLEGDSAEASAINALIQAHVDAMVQYCNEVTAFYQEELGQAGYEDPDRIYCDLYARNYEILRNDADYLCIAWRTTSYVAPGGAHPSNDLSGLVIDKHTLQPVTLADLYTVDEAFFDAADARTRASVMADFGDAIEREGISISVMYSLKQEDLQKAGTEALGALTFCLTQEGVLINPGMAHVYGDYIDVVIPYGEIEAFRK